MYFGDMKSLVVETSATSLNHVFDECGCSYPVDPTGHIRLSKGLIHACVR